MECSKDPNSTVAIDALQATGNNKDSTNELKLVKNKDENNDTKKSSFTCKQKVALFLLGAADFMSFCSMSIMAPFYPKEAESKGMSETLAGLVFSFYALIMFIFSPVFGKIIPKVGVKLVFVVGIITSGSCSIIFGFLDYIQDNTTFTVLSFAIRGLEALGSSAYSTAGYVIVINIFPNNAATVRGILETFVGLGMSVGPAVGGLLFAVGGYGLPFYVVGVFTLLLGPINIFLLDATQDCNLDNKSGSMIAMLRIPATSVVCLVITVISITWSFLDPTLEPSLRKFHLSATNIGFIFLLLSATYGIACPACGWLVDKLSNYWPLMALGMMMSSISLLFLGPSPILTFLDNSILLTIISLGALGISVGIGLMPTFQLLTDVAHDGGLGDTIGTNSIVAGLWSCVYSLGEVLGPAIGGALLEHYGFAFTSTVIAFLNFVAAICLTIYFCFRNKSKKPSKTETNTTNKQNEETTSVTNCVSDSGIIKIGSENL